VIHLGSPNIKNRYIAISSFGLFRQITRVELKAKDMGYKCNVIKYTVRIYRELGDHIGNKINNQIPKNPIHLPSPPLK
jgi:hypothetical protein